MIPLLMSFALVSANPDRLEIERVLNQWPADFNAGNAPAVCSLFAPDLLASYPGMQDIHYEQMCSKLTRVLKEGKHRYEAPEIEQVILQGDLAIVRLIWTLKTAEETVREKGLDVFKKQQDGSWKILISYAYPLEEQSSSKK